MTLEQLLSQQLCRFNGGVDMMVHGIAELERVYPCSFEQRIEANLHTFCDGERDFSYEELALMCSIALDRLAMQHVDHKREAEALRRAAIEMLTANE